MLYYLRSPHLRTTLYRDIVLRRYVRITLHEPPVQAMSSVSSQESAETDADPFTTHPGSGELLAKVKDTGISYEADVLLDVVTAVSAHIATDRGVSLSPPSLTDDGIRAPASALAVVFAAMATAILTREPTSLSHGTFYIHARDSDGGLDVVVVAH